MLEYAAERSRRTFGHWCMLQPAQGTKGFQQPSGATRPENLKELKGRGKDAASHLASFSPVSCTSCLKVTAAKPTQQCLAPLNLPLADANTANFAMEEKVAQPGGKPSPCFPKLPLFLG